MQNIYAKLLEDITNYPDMDENELIAQSGEWVYFKELSQLRTNVLEPLSFERDDHVLELFASTGVISMWLSERVNSLTAIEPDKDRYQVAKGRLTAANIEPVNENPMSWLSNSKEMFNQIICLLPSDRNLVNADQLRELLCHCKKHLTSGGRLILGVDNKYGLKYWAGNQYENTGKFFSELEGKGTDSYFAKEQVDSLIADTGFQTERIYYPYPDMWFATEIYTDDYLPKKGTLNSNLFNMFGERYLLFDEKLVFDSLLEDHKFQQFSNSYLYVLR